MSPSSQRIAIARACGYTERLVNSFGRPNCHLPDYLNDLNAMHEAKKTLNVDEQADFLRHLGFSYHDCESAVFRVSNAEAEEESEAFLKAKNLWVEEESK